MTNMRIGVMGCIAVLFGLVGNNVPALIAGTILCIVAATLESE